jgi:CAAX protease family protein
VPTKFQCFHLRDRRFVLFGLERGEVSWRGLGLLAVVFLGSLILAGALLPVLYWADEWVVTNLNYHWARLFLDNRVEKVFDFLRWAPIIAALPWLLWLCRLRSLDALGLNYSRGAFLALLSKFLTGVALVATLALGQMVFGTTIFSPRAQLSLMQIVGWIAIALIISLSVAVVEEVVFRGFILRLFYTATRYTWLALVLSSIFFAYTHFKIPPEQTMNAVSVDWATGWRDAYWMLIGISAEFDIRRFAALWILGMMLGTLMLRAGSLWPGIGLHAGLVFTALLYHDFVQDVGQAGFFWGSNALIDGWAGVLALITTYLVVLADCGPGIGRIWLLNRGQV